MRKKLLQNTLFAAMAAWALSLAHAQVGTSPELGLVASATFIAQR